MARHWPRPWVPRGGVHPSRSDARSGWGVSLLRAGGAGSTLHPLYAVRLWAAGAQLVFPLYTAVIDALQCKRGDLVLVRLHLPYCTFRVANPDLTLPVPRFADHELPPTYRDALREILAATRFPKE